VYQPGRGVVAIPPLTSGCKRRPEASAALPLLGAPEPQRSGLRPGKKPPEAPWAEPSACAAQLAQGGRTPAPGMGQTAGRCSGVVRPLDGTGHPRRATLARPRLGHTGDGHARPVGVGWPAVCRLRPGAAGVGWATTSGGRDRQAWRVWPPAIGGRIVPRVPGPPAAGPAASQGGAQRLGLGGGLGGLAPRLNPLSHLLVHSGWDWAVGWGGVRGWGGRVVPGARWSPCHAMGGYGSALAPSGSACGPRTRARGGASPGQGAGARRRVSLLGECGGAAGHRGGWDALQGWLGQTPSQAAGVPGVRGHRRGTRAGGARVRPTTRCGAHPAPNKRLQATSRSVRCAPASGRA
jgi:hypothetical protein